MALAHSTAIRNALADLVVDLVDVGTGTAGGVLQLTSTMDDYTGSNLLAEIVFPATAFGAAAAGVATALGVPLEDTTANNTGTAVQFRIIDRAGLQLLTGTVAASGADLNMSSTAITAGDAVRLPSFTYTSSL